MSERLWSRSTHCRRLWCAILLLIVGALAVLVIELFYQLNKPSVLREGVGIYAELQLDVSSLDFVEARCEEKTAVYAVQALPPEFESEVVRLDDFQEIRADAKTNLVGFSSPLACDELRLRVGKELSENHWIKTNTTELPCDSYIKQEGVYRWLLVRYTQVGSLTSVVMQYQTREKGGS